MQPAAAGFVLTGGRSSRMGENKARLQIGKHFLVELIANTVREATGNITLIGNPQAFADLPFECLPDAQPALGPLAGIETALASYRSELNLITGCDMPDLKSTDLAHLITAAAESKSLCTLTRDANGRRHPLCAVYRTEALPFIQKALSDNRLRLLSLVEELKAEEVQIDSVLQNLNTPEQWAAWKKATQLV
jgi:molybdopterin-guanine dinucleotide biosynthesis protein A